MYCLEQKSLRKKLTFFASIVSLVYELTSSYGTSIFRTLVTIFTILYFYYFQINECLEFSLKQVFSPFGEWKITKNTSTGSANEIGLLLKLTASFQSICNILLLGFLSFSLKWRFSRG